MWEDAGEINATIHAVLESAGSSTELTMELAQRVCSTFQRLRRRANNRGDHMVAEFYREFAENLNANTYEVSQAIFLDDLLTNVSANGSSLQWQAGHCQNPKIC